MDERSSMACAGRRRARLEQKFASTSPLNNEDYAGECQRVASRTRLLRKPSA